MSTHAYEAAPNQLRHWRHFCRHPGSPALNMTVALLFEESPDLPRLARAAGATLAAHETLVAYPAEQRGTLLWSARGDAGSREPVVVEHCDSAEQALLALRAEAARPFALPSEPLARARLWRLPEGGAIAAFNVHHICLDGWSVDLLIKELAARYAAERDGATFARAAAPAYADYADYQRAYSASPAGLSDRAFWQEELAGAPLGLGFARDRACAAVVPWPRGRMLWAGLPPQLGAAVRAAALELSVTPFVLLIAAFGRVLARANDTHDVLVGVPYVNRLRAQDRELVGFVVNTLPLRFRRACAEHSEYLAEVAAVTRRAFYRQRLPYIEVLRALGEEYASGATPAFRSMFILQSSQSARVSVGGHRARQAWVSTGGAKYDQTWTVEERDGGYTLDVEWNRDLYTEERVRRSMADYAGVLAELVVRVTGGVQREPATCLHWPGELGLREAFRGPVILEASAPEAAAAGQQALESVP